MSDYLHISRLSVSDAKYLSPQIRNARVSAFCGENNKMCKETWTIAMHIITYNAQVITFIVTRGKTLFSVFSLYVYQ